LQEARSRRLSSSQEAPSLEVVRRFAKRQPLGDKGPKTAPEDFLARRIKAVPEKRHFGDRQPERDR
jgi:hypothetical protein